MYPFNIIQGAYSFLSDNLLREIEFACMNILDVEIYRRNYNRWFASQIK